MAVWAAAGRTAAFYGMAGGSCTGLAMKLAIGWRRYIEIFWYAVDAARERNTMTKIPDMSDQLKAAIGGLIVMFAVVLIPQLEPMQAYLTEIVGIIIAAIIGKPIAEVANGWRSKDN